MKLSPEQILSIVHNTLSTEVRDGVLTYTRFTEKQTEVYREYNPDFVRKCYAASNVTFDFITDADTLSFSAEFALGAGSKHASGIDLLIDGTLAEYRPIDCESNADFEFTLPEGEHRITVFLPWNAQTKIKNLSISDGATVKPVAKKLRILAFGDSITQGYITAHPSLSYVGIFTEALSAEVLNQGVGGYKFRAESLEDAPDWHPDIITVAYGTNDYAGIDSRKTFEERVSGYIQKLTEVYPNIPILGITPLYRNDAGLAKKLDKKDYTFTEAREFIKSTYLQYPQATVLDGLTCTPYPADFYAPDHVHPNDLGFCRYGVAVTEALKTIIKEKFNG